jgi:lysyl-tRNA synthetase class 2
MTTDWHPTAEIETLRLRAEILARIRAFFDDRGVLEVETPLLASAPVTDLHLAALSTRYRGPGADDGRELWLQTSPEFAMKRLLAAGSGPIYQLCKAFRDGEAGSRHNPEFTLLEWYRPGWDHHRLMDEVGDLFRNVLGAPNQHPRSGRQSCRRVLQGPPQSRDLQPATRTSHLEKLTYAEAFQRHVGIDPHAAKTTELIAVARDRIGGAVPDLGDDRDGWLDLLMSHLVEPQLGRGTPTFIFDYPASQAALARVRPGNPPVAERFEAWIEGVELANGYHELNDAAEQLRRFEVDLAARRARRLPNVPIDERFLAAVEHGLPDCAGVALGVDRLVMLAAGVERIDEVISFPVDRA